MKTMFPIMPAKGPIIPAKGPVVVQGTARNDDLRYVGSRSVSIDAGAGNDTLQGGTAADSLVGGTGSDIFLHSEGADTYVGGQLPKTGGTPVFPFPASEIDTVTFANATLKTGAVIDLIRQELNAGLAAGDRFSGIERIVGSLGGDVVKGDSTANIFLGMAGNDVLEGRDGNDTLEGGAGADRLDGGAGNDLLKGGADGDVITGGTGLNTIDGDQGDDTIIGANGQDTVHGGDGNDRIDYTGNTTVRADLYGDAGNDVILSGAAGFVDGGDGNDTITANAVTGNTLAYGAVVFGRSGDDTIDYSAASKFSRISGDQGSDVLRGGAGGDLISGGSLRTTPQGYIIVEDVEDVEDVDDGDGADVIDGGGGNDRIYGNGGDDIITGSAGSDTVLGGQGRDTLDYHQAGLSQVLVGGAGTDMILGGSGNDTIHGGSTSSYGQTHILLNGAPSPTINLGPQLPDAADVIDGGAGDDRIWGEEGNDTITGSAGSDTVRGGDGDDTIDYRASTSLNELNGGGGNDVVRGGSGVDYLTAGAGIDRLSGGTGADGFKFGSDTAGTFIIGKTTAATDAITDFGTGFDFLLTGNGAGNDANYREFADARVTGTEMALLVYANTIHDNPTADGPSYTFVAGATDGYLILDSNGIATDGATGVLRLDGLNLLTGFAAGDLLA